jgi:cytochrome c oxidase cbb3-type subunit IV
MDTYSILREFADSWGLMGLMIAFVLSVLILFRPGAKAQHDDASLIPFRDDSIDDRELDKSIASKTEQPTESSS